MLKQTSDAIEALALDSVLPTLVEKIKELNLDTQTESKVIDLISDLQPKKNKVQRSITRAFKLIGTKLGTEQNPYIKRETPQHLKCTAITKSGATCNAPRTNTETMKCWAHMSQNEKDLHLKNKNLNPKQKPKQLKKSKPEKHQKHSPLKPAALIA
jgi:hypothetical protein